MEGLKRYEGKRVYVQLKNRRNYSGIVLEIEDQNGDSLITIKDKFGKFVSFHNSDIETIEEQGGKE